MVEFLKTYIGKHFDYIKIDDDNDLQIIYDLYHDDVVNDCPKSVIVLKYYAYYYSIKNDYDAMLKYYLLAIG